MLIACSIKNCPDFHCVFRASPVVHWKENGPTSSLHPKLTCRPLSSGPVERVLVEVDFQM
jgi:hypothetical protein